MTIVASVLFYNAFRRAGILKEAGRGIGPSETSDALSSLNSFNDFLLTHRLTVISEDREIFPVVSGQQVYRIGLDPSADWQVPMPNQIEKAGYLFTNTNPPVEQPFNIYTAQQWQALSPKTLQSTNEYILYYQKATDPNSLTGTAGVIANTGAVTLWPVPIDDSVAVVLYLWVQLQQIASATSLLVLPQGGQEMLETNLAVRLAAMFPKRAQISPLTIQMAKESLSRYKTANDVPLMMRVEQGDLGSNADLGTFNLFSNQYNGSFGR